MQALWRWLRQPFPYDESWRCHFRNGYMVGLFVTFFLYFFRPFGLANGQEAFGTLWLFQQCLYFGITTTFTTWAFGGFTLLFPKFFNEEDWVIGREIILNLGIILSITAANIALGLYLYNNPFNVLVVLISFWNTVLIGLFPILFGVYRKHQKWQKRYATAAASASTQLQKTAPENGTPLVLSGENQQEEVTFLANELLYVAAADNYVKLHLWQDDQLRTPLLRSSLKATAEQLTDHAQFFRCHRTYLVNLRQVVNITGNAQGYKLHFAQTEQLVPVSRKLNQEITERLPDI
ncbi:MAG: LytTR family DNA-binding domain-containing protein [Bacteroidota bacterium]